MGLSPQRQKQTQVLPQSLRRGIALETLRFGALAFRTVTGEISVVRSHPLWGNLLQQP